MIAPIQIRNDDVVRDIRLLAAITGRSITDVVAESVRARLISAQRERSAETAEIRLKVRAIQDRFRTLPRTVRPLTDADLYDDQGLPR